MVKFFRGHLFTTQFKEKENSIQLEDRLSKDIG